MATDAISQTYFPAQKKASKEKDEFWRHNCVDSVINVCYAYGRTRRSEMRNKLRNYGLFNNKIDKADFDYVLNPFSLSKDQLKNFAFPASLQPYDIISPYFQLLLGEESKRLFQPIVIAINDDAISEKQSKKKEEIISTLEEMLMAGVNPESVDPENPPTFEQVEKYKNYTPKMMRESTASHLLNHYFRSENLGKKFNDCFKDVLLAAEEIIRVDKVGDGPKATRVNPVEIWFQLNNNSDILDDAEKIYERNQMTASEIIDEFYEYLTPAQIDEIEKYGVGSNGLYNFGDMPFLIPEVDSIYQFESNWTQRGIPVHRVRWKSYKKMGSWHFIDPSGTPQEVLVEETFRAPKGDTIEWFWISEYWEGIRIGVDMYIDPMIRVRKQQFRTMDNLSECKSGYIGTVYSATNARSVSLMDRLVPWVYLYLIVWYRTELAIAKNLGKIVNIDLSLIPEGWEPEKWIYYAHAMGISFVDSYSEGNRARGAASGFNQSNQNRAIDAETGSYIQQHISLLQFIEERIQNTAGITKQRLGEISASELVGNTERAVTQSSHITEPLFFPHEDFKRRVCEALIEVSKECLKDGSRSLQYITDDMSQVLFEVQGDDFVNSDYGVFVTNSSKDKEALETYKQLLQSAIQNDKIQLSTVAKTLNSLSMSDIESKIIEGEQAMQKMQQEQMKVEQGKENELKMEALNLEKERLDREDLNKQLDRENNIQIAEIKALGGDAMGNQGDDSKGINDAAKIALEQSKLEYQRVMEEKKLALEKEKLKAEDKRTEMEKTHFNKDKKHEKEMHNKEAVLKEKLERIKLKGRKITQKKK